MEDNRMKLIFINKKAIKNNIVSYELCDHCDKNNITCMDGAELCLPLEMWVQLFEEDSFIGRLEMLDNVREYLR